MENEPSRPMNPYEKALSEEITKGLIKAYDKGMREGANMLMEALSEAGLIHPNIAKLGMEIFNTAMTRFLMQAQVDEEVKKILEL